MNIYTLLWIVLGLGFFAIEIPAIIRKGDSPDTLTDHVRLLIKNKLFMMVFGGFWVWLTLHFFAPSTGF